MDTNTKRDFILLFNQGFEEVVLPHIREINGRLDKVDIRLDQIEIRLDNVEVRLDRVENKLDLINDKLLNHDKRITVIEATPAVTHQIKK